MWIGVVTLFPEMVEQYFAYGVMGRARSEGRLTITCFNPRDYAQDKHKTVDDSPYGGGPGMVMMVEPLLLATDAARSVAPQAPTVVLMTPQGSVFTQADANAMALQGAYIFVCGRYEGIDQRFVDTQVDIELSVGDYVVSGGELPALMVIDAISRQVPGVLGNSHSIFSESHLDGLLEYPQYTRPENVVIHGGEAIGVPQALLSGDHAKIAAWRERKAFEKTYDVRPELLVGRTFTEHQRTMWVDAYRGIVQTDPKESD